MMERRNVALQHDVSRSFPTEIIGDAPKTQSMKEMISRLAPSNAAVLVEGESGTGKELVARALHQISGRAGPFVPLNCGAIAPELLESELFGHVPVRLQVPGKPKTAFSVWQIPAPCSLMK